MNKYLHINLFKLTLEKLDISEQLKISILINNKVQSNKNINSPAKIYSKTVY